jgi:superfamily II DNA or RNA helicase
MKIHEKKTKIQNKAIDIWFKIKRACLVMCTGSGKSKVGVDIITSGYYKNPLIVVPTEKLRDDRWPEEFAKWGHKSDWVDRECYASLHKIDLNKYDLIVFDEAHNLTPLNSQNFDNYKGDILGLTATPPRDEKKKEIFKKYIPIVFEYHLDEAVKDGVVAPYKINVVQFNLESKVKTIRIKTKKYDFMSTERQSYESLSRKIDQIIFAGKDSKFMALARMRFLYNLETKVKYGIKILNKYMKNDRSIIFAGSIKQAEKLCKHTFHSKTTDESYKLFKSGKINKIGTVNKLNEGADLEGLDSALILATNSNPITLIQRIGRIVRIRDNHQAIIWILCARNTQEEKWISKATSQLDSVNINYLNIEDL